MKEQIKLGTIIINRSGHREVRLLFVTAVNDESVDCDVFKRTTSKKTRIKREGLISRPEYQFFTEGKDLLDRDERQARDAADLQEDIARLQAALEWNQQRARLFIVR
jgi:hypothetical protein